MNQTKKAALLLAAGLIIAPLAGPVAGAEFFRNAGKSTPSVSEREPETSSAADIASLLALIGAADGKSPDETQTAGREADYRVLLTATGEIVRLTPEEYLRGCVAAEMPLEYEDEALKAQIVAAHTYAVSYRLRQASSPDKSLKGADISDDPASGQAYITDEEIAARYPGESRKVIERLDALIGEVGDYLLIYEGEPVVAAYHAISAGKTESAQNIWGAYSPYLVSVNSSDDRGAPDYLSTARFSASELRVRLQNAGVTPMGQAKNWFSEMLTTPSGYVSAVNFGGESLTGAELRNLLGLRSTCFSVSYDGGIFTFEVRGWGHGVGMSQYGAQQLAKKGKSYADILKTYYKGVGFCEL